jgi:hypothetical protein
MQIRKMTLMLAALGALSMTLTACGDGGRESLTCTDNTGCLENEICHPTAGVCVQTCTTTADCPDSAKNCAAIGGTNTQLICKCSTPELCQRDERVADASTLTCLSGASVCAPTGTTAGCTTNADCTGGQVCDTASGTCKAPTTGATCQGTSKSTCNYGEFCSSGACAAAPVAPATCENFSKSRPEWSASTSNGPVIYNVSLVRYETASSNCDQSGGQADAFIVRVNAYRTDADWPATRAGLAGFFYVTTGGAETDIVNKGLLIPNTGYNRNTSNLKDAEFNVALCRGPGSTTIQPGFYFTGGNPVCPNLSR